MLFTDTTVVFIYFLLIDAFTDIFHWTDTNVHGTCITYLTKFRHELISYYTVLQKTLIIPTIWYKLYDFGLMLSMYNISMFHFP